MNLQALKEINLKKKRKIMTKYLLVYPFISCFAWPLASGFLYLFSGETGNFPEYWGLTFLLLTPLFIAITTNIVIHKNQPFHLKVIRIFAESNLFLLVLYLWIFYISVFILSFIIQLPCFLYIYDGSILESLQFLIFAIVVHLFTSTFLFLYAFVKYL